MIRLKKNHIWNFITMFVLLNELKRLMCNVYFVFISFFSEFLSPWDIIRDSLNLFYSDFKMESNSSLVKCGSSQNESRKRLKNEFSIARFVCYYFKFMAIGTHVHICAVRYVTHENKTKMAKINSNSRSSQSGKINKSLLGIGLAMAIPFTANTLSINL